MSATRRTEASTGPQSTPDVVEPDDGLTQEVAFEMLSCRRRRHVLHYLLQQDREVDLRELSTQVAAWENVVDAEAVTYKQRMRVYTALRQSHLPKMDDANVIDYDASDGRASLTSNASELEVYLQVVPHDEIPWSRYYLGLGLLSLSSLVVAELGLVPFSWIPPLGWAVVVTLLFTCSAVAHSYHDEQTRLGSEGGPPV